LDFARDGINYAEIRIGLNYKNFMWSDDGERQLSYHKMMRIISELQKEELPKIRKEGNTFYGIKCIYATMRKEEREEMVWDMNMAIELKQEFPDLICGFDIAGQEDAGHSLSHWIPELLEMRRKCDELGVDLPFIFHASETLDHGGDTDSSLIDVILLGTIKIDHGYSMTKHPVLMDLCKEKWIAVETCLISNEVLGLCGTVTNHPLPVLLASNVPCTVNSDDSGVF
jgi:adenosine deaminase CECR1